MSSITIDVAVADDNHFFKEGKDCAENENPMLSHQEEEVIKKRYGGILPKKKPLISKIGHWESKEQKSRKHRLKHSAQNCSPHRNSNCVPGDQLMLHHTNVNVIVIVIHFVNQLIMRMKTA
ncbi:uncharacterized protein [Euphorbia lathyris]|uniref:uncharacterized protein isoform X2 n=1 Tax=Euphorbia lathyris TaxID=212925 RepID=UPI0033132FE5